METTGSSLYLYILPLAARGVKRSKQIKENDHGSTDTNMIDATRAYLKANSRIGEIKIITTWPDGK
jgi:hypothetical protein